MKTPLLSLKSVSAGYGGKDIIKDISFSVMNGEIFALVGESGSGKTTTLKAVTNLPSHGISISAGDVSLDGISLSSLKKESRRKLLGKDICTIFQDPYSSMNPIRKIKDQFYDTVKSHKALTWDKTYGDAIELFKVLGLSDAERIMESRPYELSGGMCQRVCIALSMAMKPKIILADEPTSALDVISQRQVMESLRFICDNFGVSVILVTHNLPLAAHYSDKIAIMKDGNIVEEGISKDIISSPTHTYTKELLSNMPEIPSSYEEKEFSEVLMSVEGISKEYTSKSANIEAVKNVSFTLHKGEILGIVGESGSGKSTLARQLLNLEIPSSGQVVFKNEVITQFSKKELSKWYKNAQMVFQNPLSSFDPRKKIRTSLKDAVKNLTDIKGKNAINEYIDGLLSRVGLDTEFAERYPKELSGGQCQRAAIARAISSSPSLLICDEATSALDASIQAKTIALLKEIVQEQNMSMIFISHDISLVSGLCDNIIVMKEGEIAEKGSTEKIMTEPENDYTKALISSSKIL